MEQATRDDFWATAKIGRPQVLADDMVVTVFTLPGQKARVHVQRERGCGLRLMAQRKRKQKRADGGSRGVV